METISKDLYPVLLRYFQRLSLAGEIPVGDTYRIIGESITGSMLNSPWPDDAEKVFLRKMGFIIRNFDYTLWESECRTLCRECTCGWEIHPQFSIPYCNCKPCKV